MRKLHQLAQELHDNDYVMTEKMKEQFEEFLSIIAKGARILHSRFGLGTVTGTQGNTWVQVDFDRDNEDYELRLKKYEDDLQKTYFGKPSRHTRAVRITSCHSIHMLLKNEQIRAIKKEEFGKAQSSESPIGFQNL